MFFSSSIFIITLLTLYSLYSVKCIFSFFSEHLYVNLANITIIPCFDFWVQTDVLIKSVLMEPSKPDLNIVQQSHQWSKICRFVNQTLPFLLAVSGSLYRHVVQSHQTFFLYSFLYNDEPIALTTSLIIVKLSINIVGEQLTYLYWTVWLHMHYSDLNVALELLLKDSSYTVNTIFSFW